MILDTTFIIDIMNNDSKAIEKLRELQKRGEAQIISSISIFELFSGLGKSIKPEKEKMKIIQALRGQLIAHFDQDAAEKAGFIDGNLRKEGRIIGPLDTMIAGVALVKKEKILTRNLKDFERIPGLEVERY